MKKLKFSLLSAFIFFICIACNEDKVTEVSKKGSIETSIKVDHLTDSLDIMTTTHSVWVKNNLVKTIVYTDTLPSLGYSMEEGENSDGSTASVLLKKEYELYITIQ